MVGGGNTAVEEALFLTNFASKVTVVHRRDRFRAEKILQDRLFKNPKISVIWDTVLEEVVGDGEPAQGEGRRSPQCQDRRIHRDAGGRGVHRHRPHAGLRAVRRTGGDEALGLHQDHAVSTATSVPGVFAAGDVTDDIYRQAVTAAGQGCMAALEAERFLARAGRGGAARVASGSEPARWNGADEHGLGQAQGLSRRGRSRQLHACGRAARPVAIGGVAAGFGAGAGPRRFAVPPPRARTDPHRAGRAAAPHRPRRVHEARGRARQADRQQGAAERRAARCRPRPASACIGSRRGSASSSISIPTSTSR